MANDKKLVEAITSMDVDFAQWYTDVVKKAELCDYSSVKGCMVIKPAGYAIWENIQHELDRRFKATGVENVYLPMLIPESQALTVVPYEERYSFIAESNCVISATSSPHTVLTADRLREYCSGEKLLIDLAVPRDIDPAAAEIPGVTLRSVDYFSSLAEDNNLRKQNSVEQAGQIIDEDIGELRKTLLLHEKLPMIRQCGTLSGLTAEELLFRLKKELSAAAFAEVIGCVLGEKG